LGSIDDWPHALLERRVLHRDALDAAEGLARLLGGTVDQVIVVLVGERAEGSWDIAHVDALSVAHRGDFGLRQLTNGVVVEAPGPAILVVDRDPEMTVNRMIAAWGDHRE